MAINLGRATFFFKDQETGWTETHWWAGSPITNLSALLSSAILLGQKRSSLLGANPEIAQIRISDDEVRRDSLVASPHFRGSGTEPTFIVGPPAAPGVADLPYSVTLIRAESGSLYRKSIYLGGVPDEFQVDAPAGNYGAGWLKAFADYQNELLQNWGFRANVREPVNPLLPIEGVTSGTPIVFKITGMPYPTGTRVKILALRGAPGSVRIRGEWYLIKISADTFSLTSKTFGPLGGAFVWGGGGQLQAVVPFVTKYTRVFIQGQTHRKRGRPFDSPRGRSKKT